MVNGTTQYHPKQRTIVHVNSLWLLTCGIVTAFSLLPPFMVGSAIHTSAVSHVTTIMFVYTLVPTLGAWLYIIYTRAQLSSRRSTLSQET